MPFQILHAANGKDMGKHQKVLDPDLAYLMELGYEQEEAITALTEAMGNVSQAFQHLFEDLTGIISIACLTGDGTCVGCHGLHLHGLFLYAMHTDGVVIWFCAQCNQDLRCLQSKYFGSLSQRLICLQIPMDSGFCRIPWCKQRRQCQS